MSASNKFKKIAEELIEKRQKDREQAINSKETIWDYKPTEEEIKKICEQLGFTSESIIIESRRPERHRLACLINLFFLRKNEKERKRIAKEFNAIPTIPFDAL